MTNEINLEGLQASSHDAGEASSDAMRIAEAAPARPFQLSGPRSRDQERTLCHCCGVEMMPNFYGRRRAYCSGRCRTRTWRERHRLLAPIVPSSGISTPG
jgi:hypothetical protein